MTVLIVSASSEGSDESAHVRKLARAFAALCSHTQSMVEDEGSGQTF